MTFHDFRRRCEGVGLAANDCGDGQMDFGERQTIKNAVKLLYKIEGA